MELKHECDDPVTDWGADFNQTRMELKHRKTMTNTHLNNPFNQTRMELKQAINSTLVSWISYF